MEKPVKRNIYLIKRPLVVRVDNERLLYEYVLKRKNGNKQILVTVFRDFNLWSE